MQKAFEECMEIQGIPSLTCQPAFFILKARWLACQNVSIGKLDFRPCFEPFEARLPECQRYGKHALIICKQCDDQIRIVGLHALSFLNGFGLLLNS